MLHSGLELGFSSQVAGQTEIGGSIVAHRLPVTPEGSSISVQELDQLALRVRSPGFQAELGEMLVPPRLQEVLGLRYMHGVRTTVRIGRWELATLLGASRAVTSVVTVSGSDGIPGPYQLRDALGRRVTALLPGSERVWVDGVLQERGEDKDYVLDYLRGELTFRPRRPISSASRIVVECATLDEESTQTLGLLQLAGELGAGHTLALEYTHRLTTPLYDIAPGTPWVFRNGTAYALAEGATWVGIDSATGRGRGWYRRRDTLIEGVPHTVWEYAPWSAEALYMVEFSPVGAGKGDYVQVAPGVFRYLGHGRGEYAPARLLPLPTQQQLLGVGWEWHTERWYSHLDWRISRFVPYRNHSEPIPGAALSIQTRYSTAADTAAAALLWESRSAWRSPFFPERRTAADEQSRLWWMPGSSVEYSAAEARHWNRVRLRWAPVCGEAQLGWAQQAAGLKALWGEVALGMTAADGAPEATLRYAGGRYGESAAPWQHLWQRLHGTVTVGRTRLRLIGEVAWLWQRVQHNTIPQQELGGQLRGLWTASDSTAVETFLSWRHQWEPVPSQWWQPGFWVRWAFSSAWKFQLRMGYNRIRQLGQWWEALQLLCQGSGVLMRRGGLWWRYESGVELVDTLALAFLRVMPGQGTYRYRGDLNGNGMQDVPEFEPTPVGGDYLLLPGSRGIARPGTGIRAEVVVLVPFANAQGEWESRLSLAQRGLLRSWRALLPQPATGNGVSATQWTMLHRLRLPNAAAEWNGHLEWTGAAFFTGSGWEQWEEANTELRWGRSMQRALRLELGGGALHERQQRAFQPGGRLQLLLLQLFAEGMWRLLPWLQLAPQLLLQGGTLWSAGVGKRVVNPIGTLQLQARHGESLTAQLMLQYGALMPRLPAALLPWVGNLLQGWRLRGSAGYQTGAALWAIQYLGVRHMGQKWWHALNGQVQLSL